MKFIDEAIVTVRGGHGGKGCVSFRRDKFEPRGGPNGGNGGRGGAIVLRPTDHMTTLLDFHYKREIEGPDGQKGMGSDCDGRAGEDVIVLIPVGTSVYNKKTGELITDLVNKEDYVIAKGGRGGKGNLFFVSSTNQCPMHAQDGEPGDELELRFELKLIADVCLVGLPNAGKSTFISVVSEARPKVADYPFTTLQPVLGVVRLVDSKPFVMVDLPGLIEGAHLGKGMGDKFLKHAERTRLVLHLVSVLADDESEALDRYELIERELEQYSREIGSKNRWVVLTKIDLISPQKLTKIKKEFLEKYPKLKLFCVSSVAQKNIKDVLVEITRSLNNSLIP